MRPSWKLALIGGEVTVLAAFTGIGIHLAMQPHRIAFRPPAIVLPATRPDVIPRVGTPLIPPRATSAPVAGPSGLGPGLLRKFGQQDHELVVEQWAVLQRLMGAIERYLEARINERLSTRR